MTLPTKIKAVGMRQTGDFDVIEDLELPFPTPAPDEILVKVHYGGVNFADTYARKGLYPVKSLPAILGFEASATIFSLPTSPEVLSDEDYKKRGFTLGQEVCVYTSGTFAEYVNVPWKNVAPVPESVSLLDAGAVFVQGLTAVTFVNEAYNVRANDRILIHTVAGGLGLHLTQLCKARGAKVIGTTSTQEKADLARKNGADEVILYKEEDTVKRVLEWTGGEGVDAIFDGVGKDTFEDDFKMIKRKGTLVSLGNASGPVPPFPPLKLVEKNVRLLRPTLGNYIHTPEEGYHYTNELFSLLSKGVLKPYIHKVYGFSAEEVRQAQKDLTGGKTVGKLIIEVSKA